MHYLTGEEAASVQAAFAVNGFSPAGRGQNQGQVFVRLKDWSERTAPNQSVQALLARVTQHYAGFQDATITAINPPPIRGLGSSAGFDLELEDLGGVSMPLIRSARSAERADLSVLRARESRLSRASTETPRISAASIFVRSW